MMDRRRALIAGEKEVDKTPIMPSCQTWHYSGNGSAALSDDSFKLRVDNSYSSYTYSTRTLTLKYSDLVGKTIVIEYDTDQTNVWATNTAYITLTNDPNYNLGNGAMKDRKNFQSTSGRPTHYYREITIGTNYTSTYTGYYLSVGTFGYRNSTTAASVKITNFKCYIKR